MHSGVYIPEEFINHIKAILPSHLKMEDFIRCCQQPLRKCIRVNTLKISIDEFLQRVAPLHWQLTPVPWCETGFWIQRPDEQENNLPLGNTAQHMAGLFYIQEASSMMPPETLFDQLTSMDMVLDMTAAPGSKSTQIAAKMNNQGLLVANELSASRIKSLSANLQRCGVSNTAISHFDASVFGRWLPETFDAILLDAPCSGEGGVRKDADALKNWSVSHLNDIASIQKQLIISAFNALKSGGELVYSTCTLNQQENQQVIQHLQQTFPNDVEIIKLDALFPRADDCVTDEGFLHVWPQVFDSEGFFVAKIRKIHGGSHEPAPAKYGKFPFTPSSRKDASALQDYLAEQFSLSLNKHYSVYQRDKEFWLFPTAYLPVAEKMRFQRAGVKIADQHRNGFRITHEFVLAWGQQAEKNKQHLNESQLVSFYKGQDFAVDALVGTGEQILCYQDSPVGLGKVVKGKIKNGLPRELVRDNKLITWA